MAYSKRVHRVQKNRYSAIYINSMNFLKGKRTYICAIAIALLSAANYLGWIDQASYQTLLGLFGAGGLFGLRAAK